MFSPNGPVTNSPQWNEVWLSAFEGYKLRAARDAEFRAAVREYFAADNACESYRTRRRPGYQPKMSGAPLEWCELCERRTAARVKVDALLAEPEPQPSTRDAEFRSAVRKLADAVGFLIETPLEYNKLAWDDVHVHLKAVDALLEEVTDGKP